MDSDNINAPCFSLAGFVLLSAPLQGIRLPDSESITVGVCGAANKVGCAVAHSVAVQIVLEILMVLPAKAFCFIGSHVANIPSTQTEHTFGAVVTGSWRAAS